jgi:hypothetical protein
MERRTIKGEIIMTDSNKKTIEKLLALLKNQKVKKIIQHNEKEILIIFESKRRFFINSKTKLEFSVHDE